MLDWLIIGGGVHGTHLSLALLRAAGVAHDRLAVLDPWDEPLARFFRFTEATGMGYLRSPAVHHLDLHPYALRSFARRGHGKRVARFVAPYDRPGLAFFRAHCESIVRAYGLAQVRTRATAIRLDRVDVGFRVETDRGVLAARRVVLAVGQGDQPCWPEWAAALRASGRVQHVFDGPAPPETTRTGERVVVIGGGITAGQLACSLMDRGAVVTLLSRHEARVHLFDSDPIWLGPAGLTGFHGEPNPDARRRIIQGARRRGSMPPELDQRIRVEAHRGRLARRRGEITHAELGSGAVRLALGSDGGALEADHVVLATGFLPHRPGGALLDDAIAAHGLPCARCGYPIVSRRLEWAPGLFVSGPLADLELGPAARNIAGARAAAERIQSAA